MKKEKTVKTMIDAAGNEVPAAYVKKYDKQRDRLVRRIEARWSKARLALEGVMAETLADVDALLAARTEETGVAPADKGNFRVCSFDGNTAVELRQSYRIFLDDRVKEAQSIMRKWAAGMAENFLPHGPLELMLKLLDEAFSANASGSLPVGKILSLLKLDISAPEWLKAKKMLEAAIQPEKGKCYLAVMKRATRQHDMERIALDVASCWPEGEEVASGE